jgi:small subunit ribosomal protein S16
MSVRIRLSRGGSKKHPFYRVVAADQRAPRDGRFIERLGSYNPLLPQDHQDRLVLDVEKVKSWLAKGAQPTERLQKLFANLGICDAPKIGNQPKKSAPKAKALERIKEKEEKARAEAEAKAQAEAEAKAAAEAAAEATTEESAEA